MEVNRVTLSTLWSRLRKKNKEDYQQFRFCMTVAVLLISSLVIMVCSPLIQDSLPTGGDSGKQIYLICGVAVVGCIIFAVYAARLFLRYKSREIGIFMALGTERKILSKALNIELAKIIGMCGITGIVIGSVLAFFVGKLMEVLTSSVRDSRFAFTISGFLFSVLYMVFLFFIIQLLAWWAMKRTNILEVINEERKQEPMKKSVSKLYVISGFIFMVIGFFGAVILERITVNIFGIWMGEWTNAFYFFILLGVYRILVYAISSHQKGKSPQKYYNNLINYGIIKFQGASVVKNMLVITLLIFAALYAISYIPANLRTEKGLEDDFSYRYLNNANIPSREKLTSLSEKNGVSIENYREGQFIRVIGSGIYRDMDEDSKLLEDYYDDYAMYDCTSVTEYEKLTGVKLDIPKGSYYQIEGRNAYENVWYKFGDMDKLYCENEGQFLPMDYLGNTTYHSLIITSSNGMDIGSRFILNDKDFARLKSKLPIERLETQVLFCMQGELKNKSEFAKDFYKLYVNGMSEDMNVMGYYNPMEEKRRGSSYADMTEGATVDADNPLKETDWQYVPIMTPLLKQQLVMLLANRILLFGYVFLICLGAVGIIGYTRSQSIGIANAQVFEDIKKLGADKVYRKELIKSQIQKVFILPTILGVMLLLFFEGIILTMNDRNFSDGDMNTMIILVGAGIAAALYQYIIYRASIKKVGIFLKLNS